MWFCKQPSSSREALVASVGCVILVLSDSHIHLTLGLLRRDVPAAPSPRTVQLIRVIQDPANERSLTSQAFKGESESEMSEVSRKCLVTESLTAQKAKFSKTKVDTIK